MMQTGTAAVYVDERRKLKMVRRCTALLQGASPHEMARLMGQVTFGALFQEARAARVPEELLARAEAKLRRLEGLYRLDADRRRHRMYYLLYEKWPCMRKCLHKCAHSCAHNERRPYRARAHKTC